MAENELNNYRMVIIGGSAGSLDVVFKMVAAISSSSKNIFVIVLHRKNEPDSILKSLLASKTKLLVKDVEDKEEVKPGTIYIAPPDYHLLLENEFLFALDSSEKIHFSRPSIDVSFESAAAVFGSSLIGILLSGANADGARGLKTIHQMGGLSIVQDPVSAEVDYMPKEAINLFGAHKIIHGDVLPAYLGNLLNPR